MIKSISFSQEQILQDIVTLHTGPIHADVTFGSGCFYKNLARPEFCFDLVPRAPGVVAADVCRLPLKDGCLRSVMFDPPFIPRTGPGSNLKSRFGAIEGGMAGLGTFYALALHELHRVLMPKGWLVFKCQDLVSGGKNHFIHCHIWEHARGLGFEAIDLFILEATRRQADPQGRPQRHARKYHCFFWIFQKRR
jgi:hypothetical protein